MAENYFLDNKQKVVNPWVYIFLLFISFVWVSLYPATSTLVSTLTLSFGNMLDFSNPNAVYAFGMILFQALIGTLMFELIFYLYRFVLAFKVYSFIVPSANLKNESRIFFIYRNLIYGVFVNLCFFFPFLSTYLGFFNLIISFAMLIVYARHLSVKYSEPIIGHFVFQTFCYPIFVYEALVIFFQVVGVL